MDIFPLLSLSFCFFIALLVIYILANDDFVLLRRHVSMTNLFDIAFLTFFVSMFFARLMYVLFHFSPGFFNPLVFFLFPYFPGLSIGGGLIGGLLFLFLYLRYIKLSHDRILDIFSISLFSALPIGLFYLAVIGKKTLTIIFAEGILIIISFVFLLVLIRFFQKGESVHDGNVSFLSLSIFSLICFLAEFFFKADRFFLFFNNDQIILFFLFILLIGIFIWQEYVSFRKKL